MNNPTWEITNKQIKNILTEIITYEFHSNEIIYVEVKYDHNKRWDLIRLKVKIKCGSVESLNIDTWKVVWNVKT